MRGFSPKDYAVQPDDALIWKSGRDFCRTAQFRHRFSAGFVHAEAAWVTYIAVKGEASLAFIRRWKVGLIDFSERCQVLKK